MTKRASTLGLISAAVFFTSAYRFIHTGLELDPDSSEYIVGAMSVSLGNGFRDLSQPGAPPISARQAGSAWVLAPLVRMRGYDIIACKALLAAIGAVAIGLAVAVVVGNADPNGLMPLRRALASAFLIALSPLAQEIHTGVYSEGPFVVWLVLASLAWCRCMNATGKSAALWSLAFAALTFAAQSTRMMGMVIWPATFLLALGSRQRRQGLFHWTVALVVAASLSVASSTGTTGIRAYWDMARRTAGGWRWDDTVTASVNAATRYLTSLGGIVLPHCWPGLQERTQDVAWTAPAAGWMSVTVAVWLVSGCWWFAGRQLHSNNSNFDFLLMLLATGQLLLLFIWPTQDRLIYSVAYPLLIVFYRWMVNWPIALNRTALVALLAVHGAWHCQVGFAQAEPSAHWKRIELAGKALAVETDSAATVLVDEHAVFLWSNRRQIYLGADSVGSLTAGNFAEIALRNSARYAAIFTWGGEALVERNPAFAFRPILEGCLWELSPNRDGVVAGSVNPNQLVQRTEESDADFKLREARHDFDANNLPAAKRALEAFLESERQPLHPFAYMLLGDTLTELGLFGDAEGAYDSAARGPSRDIYRPAVVAARSLIDARKIASNPATPKARQAAIWEAIARQQVELGNWLKAEALIARALTANPNSSSAWHMRGWVQRRTGRMAGASQSFEKALELARSSGRFADPFANPSFAAAFDSQLQIKLGDTLRETHAIELTIGGIALRVDPNQPQEHLQYASLCDRLQLPGVGLAAIEVACSRFPNDLALRRDLIHRQRGFGLAP